MTTEIKTECEYCGSDLTPEEQEHPVKNEFICCECDMEHNQFVCHRCEDYTDKDDETNIGSIFVLFEPVNARCHLLDDRPEWFDFEKHEMKPGVYRITKWPMYWDMMLSAGLYASAFEWIRELPDDMKEGGYGAYPCGPLCKDCRKELEPADDANTEASE